MNREHMATVIQDGIGLANDPKNSLSSVFKILEEKRYTPRIQSQTIVW